VLKLKPLVAQSLRSSSPNRADRDQQPAVVQDAVAGYRLIKLVAAILTSTVYAIDTIAAERTILSIFGSLTLWGQGYVYSHTLIFRCDGRHTSGVCRPA